MACFRDVLEETFPKDSHFNMGEKLEYIGKNIFLNEYIYGILGKVDDVDRVAILR